MGLAATHNALQAQVETLAAHGDTDILVFDNRGVGESSTPPGGYTTEVMARDALSLVDHVRWEDAHIVGFSMGGMIAMKLCAIARHRVRSLCLISTHLGGFTRHIPALRGLATIAQILVAPLVGRLPAGGSRLAARMCAHLDLHCHYIRRFLDSVLCRRSAPTGLLRSTWLGHASGGRCGGRQGTLPSGRGSWAYDLRCLAEVRQGSHPGAHPETCLGRRPHSGWPHPGTRPGTCPRSNRPPDGDACRV